MLPGFYTKSIQALDHIRLGGYIFSMKAVARTFKALADETRLRILVLLLDGELCVCELIAALELPQSTISRHLAYLKNAGWLEDRRHGVWMYYRLNHQADQLRAALTRILDRQLSDTPELRQAFARLETFRREHLLQGA
jgi:ArsR family transcriptional regulator